MTVVVIHEQLETVCPSARAEGESLWLSTADLQRATGWELKPEGLCKGPVCVPDRNGALSRGGAVDVAGFWRHVGNPVVHDAARTSWVLGAGATERASSLQSLEAPDFELPDIDGRMHRLSDYRGRKVMLATWASW